MVLKPFDADFAAILLGYFGWGGRIRTFTILINSEVSYRLDHAPAEGIPACGKNRSKFVVVPGLRHTTPQE